MVFQICLFETWETALLTCKQRCKDEQKIRTSAPGYSWSRADHALQISAICKRHTSVGWRKDGDMKLSSHSFLFWRWEAPLNSQTWGSSTIALIPSLLTEPIRLRLRNDDAKGLMSLTNQVKFVLLDSYPTKTSQILLTKRSNISP